MQITKGVQLHFMKTEKFKDIGISIRFRSELEPKLAASRSLLALMLCDRCETYDTKKKMSDYLDLLYGATLNAQTAGYGSAQIVEIRSKVINPRYVKGEEGLLKSLFSFLHEVLFQPLLKEHVLEESRSILKAKIERMEDDPAQYAISQGLKLAGEGDYLGISALGDVETLMQLTLDDIKQAYERMLKKDIVDVLVCGDFDDAQMEQLVKQYLPFVSRDGQVKTFYTVQNDLHDETKTEYRNITQSSIMVVWFTNTAITDADYYPLRVANAMFGQYSTSLLFQEVREKNSLCYSIYSNLISYDAALGVTTGVEKENIEKTVALIRKQFQRVCEGDFEDDLLQVSKQMIINSLKASKDSMNSLIALQYQNVLLDREWDIEDIIEKITQVERADILRAMKACELKMTFILTKEDADENNHE